LCYEKDSIYHQKAVNSIIHSFCKSNSFESTNATIEIMIKYDDFTKENLQEIVQAIKKNGEIKRAFGLPKLKSFLQRTYGISID
jgi:hypothetical protein